MRLEKRERGIFKLKSINFTVKKKELVMGLKKQTIRCLFIPNYEVGEIIKINFKKKLLFHAKIERIYPKLMKDITEKESILDGFSNVLDCQKKLLEINHIKSLNRYCFIIGFEPISTLFDFVDNKITVNGVN